MSDNTLEAIDNLIKEKWRAQRQSIISALIMKTWDYGKINIFIINYVLRHGKTYLPAVLIVIEN